MSKSILAVAVIVFSVITATGQSLQAPANPDLILAPQNPIEVADNQADTLTNPFQLISGSDTLSYTVAMSVPDTTIVDSIHVQLGTSNGGSQIGEWSFAWDNTSPGGNLTYERMLNSLSLGVGQYVLYDPVYGEIRFTDASGNTSPTTKFNTVD